jgi:hypothetical protein
MTAVVQAKCPGCQKLLRLPADWLQQAIRCKYCGIVLQARSKSVPVARPAPAPVAPLPTRPVDAAPRPVAPAVDDTFAVLDDAPSPVAVQWRMRRKARQFSGLFLMGSLLLLSAMGFGTFLYVQYRSGNLKLPGGAETKVKPPPFVEGKTVYPRRAFVISVSNYLYANPVHYNAPGKNRSSLAELLRSGLRISPDQVAELSDAVPGGLAKPPIKSAIELNVNHFLESCRPQDRALLVFQGHAVEIGDEAYLVPLEGELDKKETLVPLAWVYGQLAKCPARQKVLLLDVARLNPGRGLERPAAGPLGAKLDKALQNPPAGVQVLSTCSAGQQSYEFEDGEINGGIFMHILQSILSKGIGNLIQRTEDPLPLAPLVAEVNRVMKAELDPQQLTQTARLTGQEGTETEAVEEAAKPVVAEMPPSATGPGVATRPQVLSILKEVDVPPVKAERDGAPFRYEALPPFPAARLNEYAADEKLDPFRDAVMNARNLLTSLGRDAKNKLQEEFRATGNDVEMKKELTAKGQDLARVMARLQATLEELQAQEAARKDEPKRWQANYDYITARILAQIAFLYEYQSLLGQMKKDLPPRDPAIHGGWRLASQATLQGDTAGKKLAEKSRKLLEKLAVENPDTPWAVLAKRDRMTALGLQWQPTK